MALVNTDARVSWRFLFDLIPSCGWKVCLMVATSEAKAVFERDKGKTKGR